MNNLPDPLKIALVSAIALVTAAVIGGVIGLIGHWTARSNARLQSRISKEIADQTNCISQSNAKLQTHLAANVKLADFRQAWINGLRDDMAAFQALGVTPGVAQRSEQEFYRLGTRIELRMNPQDPDYDELHECLYAFLHADDDHRKYAANPRYVEVCQRILKREWDVLKNEVQLVTQESTCSD